MNTCICINICLPHDSPVNSEEINMLTDQRPHAVQRWQPAWLPPSMRNSCYIRQSNGLSPPVNTQGRNTMDRHTSRVQPIWAYHLECCTRRKDKMWNCRRTAWEPLSHSLHDNAARLWVHSLSLSSRAMKISSCTNTQTNWRNIKDLDITFRIILC